MTGLPLHGNRAGPSGGAMLADYELGEEIHRSGSGAVFLAVQKRGGTTVVVKRKDTAELGGKKEIENEAQLLQKLHHPNVAKCLASFSDEYGSFFLVIEHADLGDLGVLLDYRRGSRRFLDEREIWGLFTQICAGVSAIHQQRIIHRDLKPRNILLFADEEQGARVGSVRMTAKIADLGVGRQLGDMTLMADTFYGTPLYM
jgi:NIMA (never in mitosis gene a)-related kinase